MSTEFSRKQEINNRLKELVKEISGGNASEFAKLTGVKVQTFHSYLKGQIPKTEAVLQICVKFNLNANWFLRGIGPKYMNILERYEKNTVREDDYIALIEKWRYESAKNDPRNKDWFELQFEKKFPEFKEWLAANEAESNKGEFVRSRDAEAVT